MSDRATMEAELKQKEEERECSSGKERQSILRRIIALKRTLKEQDEMEHWNRIVKR